MKHLKDKENFAKLMEKKFPGAVRKDEVSRAVYSVDASIFQVKPVAIISPRNTSELIDAVNLAAEYAVPITTRGAGTGITGGCLGEGLIIDTSKYLTTIYEINIEEHYAICDPGVVQDDLNRALLPYGFRLGPETSTGNRATIGGMLANNAAGATSLRYGMMSDHILEVDLVLSSGETMRCRTDSSLRNDAESRIAKVLTGLSKKYGTEIEHHFPKIPRRASGYNLSALLENPTNIAKLVAGSEGTLGVISRIKIQIVPNTGPIGLCIIPFGDLQEALSNVPAILKKNPFFFEMIDRNIIERGRHSPTLKSRLDWLKDTPEALLIVGVEAKTSQNLQDALNLFAQEISSELGLHQVQCISEPSIIQNIWAVRKAGLELLLAKRSYARAVAFIEDIAVPPEHLPPFMNELLSLLHTQDAYAGIYGHVGAGCMHIRPYLDLRKQADQQRMITLLKSTSELVLRYQGVLSGEHGDGFIRSWLNRSFFHPSIYQIFKEIKQAFDPLNIMNPAKITSEDTEEELLRRLKPAPKEHLNTFLDFEAEGGFSLSVDMCNGNGLCRKKTQVMCPSFQASRDEYDTTRARAQALRAAISGGINTDTLSNPELIDVLDLCLECKGCKKECPSQVDMAKMKAEVLYQYQETYGYSLRSRLFANIDSFYKIASLFPKAFNVIKETSLAKFIGSQIGITPHRTLPSLAATPFSKWWKGTPQKNGSTPVVLFNDTFNEFHCPEVGISAVKVLQSLGHQVVVPKRTCCGRPLISKGFLRQARKKAIQCIDALFPWAEREIPIIVLEPSCLSVLTDDLKSLIPDRSKEISMIQKMSQSLETFLAKEEVPHLQAFPHTLHIHGHCHQKSLEGTGDLIKVLNKIPQANVTEIPTGCCGMAGSFGYEKEHYSLSIAIANLTLFPAISHIEANDIFVANGFSCRNQITCRSHHVAEVLAQLIDTLKE
ncbi:MAG: FAD-binding and (Fe-S)-binding domain-containing protein [Chlamydiales bacterium]